MHATMCRWCETHDECINLLNEGKNWGMTLPLFRSHLEGSVWYFYVLSSSKFFWSCPSSKFWLEKSFELMSKAPRYDSFRKFSMGYLKRKPRIFHWIITHVLRPRIWGHSRIGQAEVHLVYILQSKFKINWPNYFMSRMFAVRDCNKGSSLCYISLIAKILKDFHIGVPNFQCISPGQA